MTEELLPIRHASAHFQINPATWELTGRLLLHQPTETEML